MSVYKHSFCFSIVSCVNKRILSLFHLPIILRAAYKNRCEILIFPIEAKACLRKVVKNVSPVVCFDFGCYLGFFYKR